MIDSLRASDTATSIGILDADRSLWGTEVLGVPVLGGDELLPELKNRGASHFIVGLGGVGDNGPRRRLFELGMTRGLVPLTVCHSKAVVSPWAEVGAGSAIFPTAVVNAGAVLGVNVIVNTGAIVEHDCVSGNHVHVATGAKLASTVRVEEGAHIGLGASIRQGICIGEGAIVGAGAAVVSDVDPIAVVVGVPARGLRRNRPGTSSAASPSRKVAP